MRCLPSDYQHTHKVWCRPMEGSSSNSHHTLHLLEEWLKTMEGLTDQACYHNYLRQKYIHFSLFSTFFSPCPFCTCQSINLVFVTSSLLLSIASKTTYCKSKNQPMLTSNSTGPSVHDIIVASKKQAKSLNLRLRK